MRRSIPFVPLFAVCAAIAVAQPVVNQGGIVNAASYGLDSLPNAGIAQGSIFTVFGAGLGPATLQLAGAFPLAATLGGTSIKVTAGGTTTDAIMLYTSAGQVAAILPSKTPVGAGTLTLTYNAKASSPMTIHVVRSNFGIFARSMAGSGPAVVQNFVSQASMPFNSPIQVAQPGQVMVLWGTGLGPVNVDETNPPGAVDPGTDVEVWVGNQKAAVQYKGRSPNFAGEDQINFQLPQNVPQGCYVPVAIKAGGVMSNFTSMAIGAQGIRLGPGVLAIGFGAAGRLAFAIFFGRQRVERIERVAPLQQLVHGHARRGLDRHRTVAEGRHLLPKLLPAGGGVCELKVGNNCPDPVHDDNVMVLFGPIQGRKIRLF